MSDYVRAGLGGFHKIVSLQKGDLDQSEGIEMYPGACNGWVPNKCSTRISSCTWNSLACKATDCLGGPQYLCIPSIPSSYNTLTT